MSEAMFRALLGACGHTGGTVIPDGPPQPAVAPPEPPRWPVLEWTTGEAIAREPTRTLWRINTWRGGLRVDTREEWRPPSEDDEPTGLESRGG